MLTEAQAQREVVFHAHLMNDALKMDQHGKFVKTKEVGVHIYQNVPVPGVPNLRVVDYKEDLTYISSGVLALVRKRSRGEVTPSVIDLIRDHQQHGQNQPWGIGTVRLQYHPRGPMVINDWGMHPILWPGEKLSDGEMCVAIQTDKPNGNFVQSFGLKPEIGMRYISADGLGRLFVALPLDMYPQFAKLKPKTIPEIGS